MTSIAALSTEKEIRHRLKYLYLAITNLSGIDRHSGIFSFYIHALRSKNLRKLAFFEKFGDTPRHQINNLTCYVKSRKLGFNVVTIDEHGWLQRPEWSQTISFPLPTNYIENKIVLAEGNNHKWTYGISIYFPVEGSGFAPSIYGQIFETKEACLKAAAYQAKRELLEKIESEEFKKHADSYRTAKQILCSLDELIATETQLTLF